MKQKLGKDSENSNYLNDCLKADRAELKLCLKLC